MKERSLYWKLDGHTPVPASGDEGRALLQDCGEMRTVARDVVEHLVVSTMFLAIDRRFGEGPPILFETMIFKRSEGNGLGDSTGYQERYATWDEAISGHARAVAEAMRMRSRSS